jgi:hypothetical protein
MSMVVGLGFCSFRGLRGPVENSCGFHQALRSQLGSITNDNQHAVLNRRWVLLWPDAQHLVRIIPLHPIQSLAHLAQIPLGPYSQFAEVDAQPQSARISEVPPSDAQSHRR